MDHILIISAHPDDLEIGMGGTVAKLIATGFHVTSVVLTDGRRSANAFGWSEDTMANTREAEVRRAADVLGISMLICLGLRNLKDTENYQEALQRVTMMLEELKPVEIYAPHYELDRHSTHRIAGQIARDAVKGARLASPPVVWAYEVWGLFSTWDRVEYIDEQISKKILAIAEHKSQTATIPYSDGVIGLNRWRAVFVDPHGSSPQGAFAEVFLSVGL